jgi:hypothetical protein
MSKTKRPRSQQPTEPPKQGRTSIEKKSTTLHAIILQRLKEREKTYAYVDSIRSTNSFISLFSMLVIAIGIGAIVYSRYQPNIITREMEAGIIIVILFGAVNAVNNYIIGMRLPIEKPSRDLRFWKTAQIRSLSRFFLVTSVSVVAILYGDITAKWGLSKLIYAYITCYLVFAASIAVIYCVPSLIFSRFLGFVGSFCFCASYLTFYLMIVLFIFKVEPGNVLTPIATIALLIVAIPSHLNPLSMIKHLVGGLLKRKGLNLLQDEVLSMVHPSRIMEIIREKDQIFRDRLKALQIKLRTEEGITEGVKIELIKLYLEERENINGRHLAIFLLFASLIYFALGAVGEGFVQDLIYEPIKPYLCQWGIISC